MINTGYTSSNSSSGAYAHWHWTHIATAAADPLIKTCVSARGTTNAYWYYYGNASYPQASNQTLYVSVAGSNTYAWWVAAPMRSQPEVPVLMRNARLCQWRSIAYRRPEGNATRHPAGWLTSVPQATPTCARSP
jgi:hypothetical protein